MTPEEELKHLREQVAYLQKRGTELVEERRGIRGLVWEFHRRNGYPTRSVPAVPDAKEVQFRLHLIAEEFFELLVACGIDKSQTFDLEVGVGHLIHKLDIRKLDLPEVIDALGDMDYLNEGTRLTFGVDGWPVLLEIQRANMKKTNSSLEAADAAKVAGTTKAQKPSNWHPPDIEGELLRQGWKK